MNRFNIAKVKFPLELKSCDWEVIIKGIGYLIHPKETRVFNTLDELQDYINPTIRYEKVYDGYENQSWKF